MSGNEAPTPDKGLLPITLDGNLSSGDHWEAEVFLPHPFTFLVMKLFAFRDRLEDANKEFGRYHALDLYTILATMTEDEWQYGLKLRDQNKNEPFNTGAGHLVSEYFSAHDRLGIIRLKESPYYRSELELEKFISALQELFPTRIKSYPEED